MWNQVPKVDLECRENEVTPFQATQPRHEMLDIARLPKNTRGVSAAPQVTEEICGTTPRRANATHVFIEDTQLERATRESCATLKPDKPWGSRVPHRPPSCRRPVPRDAFMNPPNHRTVTHQPAALRQKSDGATALGEATGGLYARSGGGLYR